MDIEYQLLLAVLALQLEFIDTVQMTDACADWSAQRETPLTTLMEERGWLSDDDRCEVNRLLARKLKKHGGSIRASLQASLNTETCTALWQSENVDVRRLLNALSITDGTAKQPSGRATESETESLPPTVDYIPHPRRFQTLNIHGEGGMGMVWRSRDQELHRDVALKRLKPQRRNHPEALSRFFREALITGQLEHPNIVPVYDLGRDPVGHDPFYVMKLVHGRTLHKAIREHHRSAEGDRPDPSERRRLLGSLVQIGQAIAYAHARGVLHLDLKPINVVLGDFGEVIVLDWGLARLNRACDGRDDDVPDGAEKPSLEPIVLSHEALAHGTTAGRVQGSTEYMAPEQAVGVTERLDGRADVFGLGAILYEILTGQPPRRFGDEPMATVLERISFEPPLRPRAVLSSVPSALDDLCARAMAMDPVSRIPSAAAFVHELETWLADEPLVAYREIVAGFEKMMGEYPEVIDYQEQLARNQGNLGLVLDGLGRHLEAATIYRSAITNYEAVVAAQPLVPGPRADLAAIRTHLARALQVLGRGEEADAERSAALADYNALAAAHPPAREYTTGLASVYLTLPQALRPTVTPSPPQSTEEDSSVPTTEETASLRPESEPTGEGAVEFQRLQERGRLQFIKEIGRGGLSAVYLAHDPDLNRNVAVKIVRDELRNSMAQLRFVREAQITAQLEHPHIVPVHALGYRSDDKIPFLIMRLVSSSSLKQAITEYHQRRGLHHRHTAELGQLLRWLVEVCDALAFAHARGIIHRDPKPANVLFGPSGEALLVDWGLAKVINQPDAPSGAVVINDPDELEGSIIGTPAYMAPEQARGAVELIDARTDIYAVGAGLFEILTGRLPFQPNSGDGIRGMFKAITAGPVPRARSVDPFVPAALDAICAKAMAREPNDRYATALDLKRDLEGWLYGGPITVYRESRFLRAWRRLRQVSWVTPS